MLLSMFSTQGSFKYGLCGCCDGKICCRSVWWNTAFFQCIPLAQLLNRFHWSPCSVPTKMNRSTVFGMVIGIYLLFIICDTVYGATIQCVEAEDGTVVCSPGGVQSSILYGATGIFYIVIIVVLVRARIGFRNHYKIQGNCYADFCTMWCCSCCSIIQMLRQTHNEDTYAYSCCSCMTGLQDTAPEIV
jgi:Cys-rich protein (TIGR01571 family)